mgnify:CR=1 FL=1
MRLSHQTIVNIAQSIENIKNNQIQEENAELQNIKQENTNKAPQAEPKLEYYLQLRERDGTKKIKLENLQTQDLKSFVRKNIEELRQYAPFKNYQIEAISTPNNEEIPPIKVDTMLEYVNKVSELKEYERKRQKAIKQREYEKQIKEEPEYIKSFTLEKLKEIRINKQQPFEILKGQRSVN